MPPYRRAGISILTLRPALWTFCNDDVSWLARIYYVFSFRTDIDYIGAALYVATGTGTAYRSEPVFSFYT